MECKNCFVKGRVFTCPVEACLKSGCKNCFIDFFDLQKKIKCLFCYSEYRRIDLIDFFGKSFIQDKFSKYRIGKVCEIQKKRFKAVGRYVYFEKIVQKYINKIKEFESLKDEIISAIKVDNIIIYNKYMLYNNYIGEIERILIQGAKNLNSNYIRFVTSELTNEVTISHDNEYLIKFIENVKSMPIKLFPVDPFEYKYLDYTKMFRLYIDSGDIITCLQIESIYNVIVYFMVNLYSIIQKYSNILENNDIEKDLISYRFIKKDISVEEYRTLLLKNDEKIEKISYFVKNLTKIHEKCFNQMDEFYDEIINIKVINNNIVSILYKQLIVFLNFLKNYIDKKFVKIKKVYNCSVPKLIINKVLDCKQKIFGEKYYFDSCSLYLYDDSIMEEVKKRKCSINDLPLETKKAKLL